MTEEVWDVVEDLQGSSFVHYWNFTGNLESLYAHSLKYFAASHDELNSGTLNRDPKRVVEKIINSIEIFSL
jgi:hypothetical protein